MDEQSNKNQGLIDGLREAADWLDAHPDFPDMTTLYGSTRRHALRLWVTDKADLQSVARKLGSFTKQFSDHYFELHKPFGDALEIEVNITRNPFRCWMWLQFMWRPCRSGTGTVR